MTKTSDFQINDLVQIVNHPEESVVGTILQVEEIRDEGVQGFIHIPYKGDAYFRIDAEDVVKVGHTKGRHGNEKSS